MGNNGLLLWAALAAAVLLAAAPGQAAGLEKVMAAKKMSLELTVGPEVFQKAGLTKLSQAEQRILADWIEERVAKAVAHTEKTCGQVETDPPPVWPLPGPDK